MKSILFCKQSSSGHLARTLLCMALVATAACTAQATPTLFVPPTGIPILPAAAVQRDTATPAPTNSPTATVTPVVATPTPCSNDLQFVQDVTIPDGTTVSLGAPVDKQWLVTNTGTCDWTSGYRLKMISGDAMGAPTEQALYPARAGTQTTLRIVFTAPQTAGTYQSAWQAYAPDGTAFGQAVYMQVAVAP
jgi:hypothetical protein